MVLGRGLDFGPNQCRHQVRVHILDRSREDDRCLVNVHTSIDGGRRAGVELVRIGRIGQVAQVHLGFISLDERVDELRRLPRDAG